MKPTAKQLTCFLAGIVLNSIGISLVTKAFLGTSPISSLPFVLSLGLWPSFGELTFCFNMLFLLSQILLLKKEFPKMQLLQIPITLCFSALIDLHMYLFRNATPESYLGKILLLLFGCAVMALGITMGIIADFLLTPGDAFVRAIAKVTHRSFGTMKICFDMTIMTAAVLCSFLLFGRFRGVREGTLISAFLVGSIVNFYQKIYHTYIEPKKADTLPSLGLLQSQKNRTP